MTVICTNRTFTEHHPSTDYLQSLLLNLDNNVTTQASHRKLPLLASYCMQQQRLIADPSGLSGLG